ncbi:MAG: hypothetical protein CMM50_00645 [Rhodospirillaceae bacterium]|nr:hypothetical protein [Rhodospirillaceae bacterium]
MKRHHSCSVLLATAAVAVSITAAGSGVAAESSGMLRGTIELAVGASLAAGDRLVVRIYHPGADGLELDPKYWIFDEPALPMPVALAPTAEMSGNARWGDYVVEAFSDRDGDVLSLVPGELWAGTDGPLPLGASDFVLELAPRP